MELFCQGFYEENDIDCNKSLQNNVNFLNKRQSDKVVTVLLVLAILLGHQTDARVKDPDEDRAYEFGFTIEGMQHRHEKKDVNGIIQGEFGFITADGVYHVTVYATDENGNFKILSMRNIKISPPLDGSPDRSSNLPQGKQPSVETAPKAPQVHKRTDDSTTKSPSRPFTTQPSIKPACAGCGYITTTTKPLVIPLTNPNGLSVSQGETNPITEKNGQRASTPNNIVNTGNINLIQSPITNISQSNPSRNIFKTPHQLPPNKNIELLRDSKSHSNTFVGHQLELDNQSGSLQLPESPRDKYEDQLKEMNPPVDLRLLSNRFSDNLEEKSHTKSFSNPLNDPENASGDNKVRQHSSQLAYKNPESLKVINRAIKIPGNKDILIKDKYPGMVDGLPPGIEEKDISDILYRFNWTVGFQGHYETGYKNGAKIGGYFVNGSDGINRVVTYVADEFGYRPKVRLINVGVDSPSTPKDDKSFKLESFEFVWYPVN